MNSSTSFPSRLSDLTQELVDKQSGVHLLEREVNEGRRRCTELEGELDQVNQEIGEARVDESAFLSLLNYLSLSSSPIEMKLVEPNVVLN